MWSNPQETSDLVTFTEGILDGKLHYLCSVCGKKHKPKMLAHLVEILCFTREELGGKYPMTNKVALPPLGGHTCAEQWVAVAVASMAMFKKGDELKKNIRYKLVKYKNI